MAATAGMRTCQGRTSCPRQSPWSPLRAAICRRPAHAPPGALPSAAQRQCLMAKVVAPDHGGPHARTFAKLQFCCDRKLFLLPVAKRSVVSLVVLLVEQRAGMVRHVKMCVLWEVGILALPRRWAAANSGCMEI